MSDEVNPSPLPSDHLAALGQVTGELVHDLANEVQILEGWAVLARGEALMGRPAAMELQRVVDITGRLGRMLRDVLESTAGQHLSPEVAFDPEALTEATVNERVRNLGSLDVRLVSRLSSGVRVAGRASFWSRAIGNLLSNAERFAYRQILVRLHVEQDLDGRGWVRLRVEDDGPGIPPDERKLIFQPLWHGAGGGTGLGLSSVSWSVAQLNGTVRYVDDSTLGGAAFEIRVPAAESLVASPAPPPAISGALAGVRLLLIDDDASVRLALCRILGRAGAEVRELNPLGMPEESLVRSILGALPDIILLDLHLGERGGASLWRRLDAEVPHLGHRVAFVTGMAPGDPRWEEAYATGQPVLGKPFSIEQLLSALGRLRTGG